MFYIKTLYKHQNWVPKEVGTYEQEIKESESSRLDHGADRTVGRRCGEGEERVPRGFQIGVYTIIH